MAARYSFSVYIDEAGDPGIKAKVPVGASEWFVVSAVVLSADRDLDAVDWLRDMREAVRMQQRQTMHYRNLSQTNKHRVCRMLSTKNVRLFTVASHKSNMRGRQNPRLKKQLGKDEFYNWCLRLLFERVTTWCSRRAKLEGLDNQKGRIVFSERGGHDYQHLKAYLGLLEDQAVTGHGVKLAREIVPGVITPELIEVRRHDDLAGLQLADICASAFFQAANIRSAEDLEPAAALLPRVARDRRARTAAEFGLLRLPFSKHGEIPEASRPLFEKFGYQWDKSAGPGLHQPGK
ncbi:DUF3800 domain-containing protein [Sphingomonas sp. GB1N7]|uniref:DUF3800 domain-containing protein n=1 Tax=Parasphingomonas caseinilytica TaxID=3096158 RepID=UPI002FCB729F